MSDFDYVTMIL